jgi:glycine/D-amino acid oxidase-like deaminating enzyme/nitrite reductase/ring-hydroxylating ferredoxin subunit
MPESTILHHHDEDVFPPGSSRSLWIETTPETSFERLEKGVSVDVAVIGGGIAGITAAYLLKQAGRSVAVVEADRILRGVTGHTTAKLTSAHGLIYDHLVSRFGKDQASLYAQANQTAIEKVASLVRDLDIDCGFRRTAAYTYADNQQDVRRIRSEVEAARTLGLPVSYVDEYIDEAPLPFPIAGAIRFDNQAEFHPRKYLLALAKTVPGRGSHIFEQTRALHVEEGASCKVATDQGTLSAQDVVVATHFPFSDEGMYFARLYPRRSYLLALHIHGKLPEGMFYGIGNPYHSIRSYRTHDDGFLIVGGENHKTGQGGDTIDRYKRVLAFAQKHFDVQSVDYHWSTQDNFTIDRIPYIGRLASKFRHVYVAAGFGGWGMSQGTVAGMLLSDMILGRPNPWESLFDPSRFDAAKEFTGRRYSKANEKELENLLHKDEGAVFEEGKEKIGVYRDKEERLRKVSPVCTHMGCLVDWNNAEESWDCPCHGSRFSADGKVIHGPALHDLRPIEEKPPETFRHPRPKPDFEPL